jgi:hypothetical protein
VARLAFFSALQRARAGRIAKGGLRSGLPTTSTGIILPRPIRSSLRRVDVRADSLDCGGLTAKEPAAR